MTGEGRSFAVRTAAFCAVLFFGLGINLPYFPLWLAAQGLSGPEISTIVAAPLLLRVLFAPGLAHLAEKFPHLAIACVIFTLAAGFSLALLAIVTGYWTILVLFAVGTLLLTILISLGDAILIAGVAQHRIDYGRVRVWGSVGFVAASFAGAAAIDRYGEQAILAVLLAATFTLAAVALLLPRVTMAGITAEPYGFRRVFGEPTLRRALIAGNLILAAHGAYYTFASLYWESRGFGEGMIGALWAISIVAEIALFWWARHLSRWGARRFLIAGGIGAGIRWMLFPFVVWPPAALALQLLHGLTFAATHLGVMMAIGAVAAPGHTARIQAAHLTLGGLLVTFSTLVAGPLYQAAPVAAFWVMAAFALPGVVLAWGMQRGLHPHSAVVGGSTFPPE